MARYRLNTSKYALKTPKKHQKRPTFHIKPLSTLSDPHPLWLINFFEINNIHIKKFCYPPSLTPPPPCPYPLLSKLIIFLLLLFNPFRFFPIVLNRYRLNITRYVIKELIKQQKVPKFNKKPYPNCPTPPHPSWAYPFF